jgi:micrococcal nuclease
VARIFSIDALRGRRPQRRRNRRQNRFVAPVVAAVLVPLLIAGAINIAGLDRLESMLDLAPPVAASGPIVSASFPICGSARRVTCVVDGDSIWLEGTRIRIADLDAPEISQPGCAAEAERGARARDRLAALLNAGAFEVTPADRDEDRYGRKLRVLVRDGRSIADDLVSEGLAGYWATGPHDWC